MPGRGTRHLLNRFSYGVTPQLYREARRRGGAQEWFEWQLRPRRIGNKYADSTSRWFPALGYSSATIAAKRDAGTLEPWDVMADFARWTLLRRIYSRRQVQEVMTEFWSNLLHVPAPSDTAWAFRISYDKVIRRHALGRFDDLLQAAIVHPAMLCYLDNARSVARNPNENLGRELLELHTVGRLGGYDEADVRNSALILTGWRVDTWDGWRYYYSRKDHHVGRVTVMGFSDANRNPDGRALTRRYLRYLAHHPATARRIAQRLAVRFVSDDPPADLVNKLTRVYLSSGTDIKAVLRALVRHPAFARSVDDKVRTPTEDLIATYRVLGIRARRPTGRASDLSDAILWQGEAIGQRPFAWNRPDGFPDAGDAWTSVSRMLGSWRTHKNLAGGYWPRTAIDYREPMQLLPDLPARFDFVVDHLSRQLLARPASRRLIDACCAVSGIRRGERITRNHPLVRWKLPRVVAAVLDTPAHMTR